LGEGYEGAGGCDRYEVRNVQDLLGAPISGGTVEGSSITIPRSARTHAPAHVVRAHDYRIGAARQETGQRLLQPPQIPFDSALRLTAFPGGAIRW